MQMVENGILKRKIIDTGGKLWYAEYVGAAAAAPCFLGRITRNMKTLYLIGGTMGVGKTTVCLELKKLLPNSVLLDGDWCWDMDPFVVNDETKAMVMDNICHLLNNFLKCSHMENVIFCWVMHEQSIINEILSRLDLRDCEVRAVSLTCTEEALRQRLQKDIDRGLRSGDILQRSIPRLRMYETLNTLLVDTTGKIPAEIADQILRNIGINV